MYLFYTSLKIQGVSNRDIIEALRHFSSKKMKELEYVPDYITRGTKKHYFAREDKENFYLTRIRRGEIEKVFPKFIGYIDKQKPNLKIRFRLSKYSLLSLIVLLLLTIYFCYNILYKNAVLGYTNSIVFSIFILYLFFLFIELSITKQSIKTAINRYINDEIKYAV